MCKICERLKAEEQERANQEHCIRFVCQCGNLLGRAQLMPDEKPGSITVIGPCCADLVSWSPHIKPFEPYEGYEVTEPGAYDEREAPREE